MSPTDANFTRVLAVTNELAALIEAENTLLIERRARELAGTEHQKAELSRTYQEELIALRRIPGAAQSASPEMRQELRKAGTRLNRALDEQRRRVLAARTVSERVLRAIMDEVAKVRSPVQAYNRTAAPATPSRRRMAATPTAVAFHQVV